jgi:tripartite-type tricarboxylate transporter receptor subunit TctC
LLRRTCLAVLASLAVATGARAAYPERVVKIIVPFPPGGTTDLLARLVADRLDKRLGQRFLVENRGGASGSIGTQAVATSEPDGYTLVMATINTHGINAAVFKSLPYDPVRDFAPITIVASTPNVLMANPALGVSDLAGLLKLAKDNPGKLDFGSTSLGGSPHMSGELLKTMAGVNLNHVPYRGGGPMLNDLIAGHIKLGFDNLPSAIGHVRGGSVKALAVTTAERFPSLPDVPTIAESGVPGYEVSAWFGLLAPAKTPPDVIARLNREVAAALKSDAVRARIAEQGADVASGSPEDFAKFLREETERLAAVIRRANIHLD